MRMQVSRILCRKEIKLNTFCIISLLMYLHKNKTQIICLTTIQHDFNKSLLFDNLILLLANFQDRKKSISFPFAVLAFKCTNKEESMYIFLKRHTKQCSWECMMVSLKSYNYKHACTLRVLEGFQKIEIIKEKQFQITSKVFHFQIFWAGLLTW